MTSSRMGWLELPYAEVPFPLAAGQLQKYRFCLSEAECPIEVTLISGICSESDVMRGEECELLGLVQLIPELKQSHVTVVLPGTHSKHVQLYDGEIKTFTTYMTGELYSHLRSLPTLKAALSGNDEIEEAVFGEGVLASREFGLSAALFKIRSRSLLFDGGANHGLSYLSGILIGAELNCLADSAKIVLCGCQALQTPYLLASEFLDRQIDEIPEATFERALLHAHRSLLEG